MANIINIGSTNCPFPVGYGGFFQSDPNSIYAGTTWEQKKDVFILASGDSYKTGETGGESTHTLTVNEMPSHKHTANGAGGTQGQSFVQGAGSYAPSGKIMTVEIGSTGGGKAHNNMPPYYSMPFWIRTE